MITHECMRPDCQEIKKQLREREEDVAQLRATVAELRDKK
jgi:hypothetical protein